MNKEDLGKKSQTKLRDFDDSWLSLYRWLRYDSDTKLMTCQICIDSGKSNILTKGCHRKLQDVLDEHVELPSHKEALKDKTESKKSKEFFNRKNQNLIILSTEN